MEIHFSSIAKAELSFSTISPLTGWQQKSFISNTKHPISSSRNIYKTQKFLFIPHLPKFTQQQQTKTLWKTIEILKSFIRHKACSSTKLNISPYFFILDLKNIEMRILCVIKQTTGSKRTISAPSTARRFPPSPSFAFLFCNFNKICVDVMVIFLIWMLMIPRRRRWSMKAERCDAMAQIKYEEELKGTLGKIFSKKCQRS